MALPTFNPGNTGFEDAYAPYRAAGKLNEFLSNAIKTQYQPQMTEAELQKQQLYNQYYGQDVQSQIAQRLAEAEMNRFKIQHPEYMAGDAAYLAYLQKHPELFKSSAGQSVSNAPAGMNDTGNVAGATGATGATGQYGATDMTGGFGSSGTIANAGSSLQSGLNNINQTADYSEQPPVELPNLLQAFLNKKNYGTAMDPIRQAKLDLWKESQKQNITEGIKESNQAGNIANQSFAALNTLNAMEDAYRKSTYKGQPSFWKMNPGAISTTGLAASILGDMSNEQRLDQMSANLQAQYAPLLHVPKIAGPEISYLQSVKPGRFQNEQAFFSEIPRIKASILRGTERAEALNYGTQIGLKPSQINALFNTYQKDFPEFTEGAAQPNFQNLGKWREYFTPEAVAALKKGNPIPKPKTSMADNDPLGIR